MPDVELELTAQGIVIQVKAQAGARKNGVQGCHAGALKVAVTQAPEKGKANRAIAQELSRWLEVAKSRVVLVSGTASTQKRFLLREVPLSVIQRKIQQLETE